MHAQRLRQTPVRAHKRQQPRENNLRRPLSKLIGRNFQEALRRLLARDLQKPDRSREQNRGAHRELRILFRVSAKNASGLNRPVREAPLDTQNNEQN